MKINKLGITFGDNDFGTTLRHFLGLLVASGFDPDNNDLTKETLVELFNKSAGTIYNLAQAGISSCGYSFDADNYLQISVNDVQINSEVDEYIAKHGPNCNSEFFYVDYTLHADHPYAHTVITV